MTAIYDDRFVTLEQMGGETKRSVVAIPQIRSASIPGFSCLSNPAWVEDFIYAPESAAKFLCLKPDNRDVLVYVKEDMTSRQELLVFDGDSVCKPLEESNVSAGNRTLLFEYVSPHEFAVLTNSHDASKLDLYIVRITSSKGRLNSSLRRYDLDLRVLPDSSYEFGIVDAGNEYRGHVHGVHANELLFSISKSGHITKTDVPYSSLELSPNGELAAVFSTSHKQEIASVDWQSHSLRPFSSFSFKGQRYYGWAPDSRHLLFGDQRISGAFLNVYNVFEERLAISCNLRNDTYLLPLSLQFDFQMPTRLREPSPVPE
ncbi:MAG: hypothetical protein HYV27_01620 [Candidatus Hydrogenedentes bacterium]|nr:hypothetical protein [Candidatus Hydrogenedentota bacterium]